MTWHLKAASSIKKSLVVLGRNCIIMALMGVLLMNSILPVFFGLGSENILFAVTVFVAAICSFLYIRKNMLKGGSFKKEIIVFSLMVIYSFMSLVYICGYLIYYFFSDNYFRYISAYSSFSYYAIFFLTFVMYITMFVNRITFYSLARGGD